MAAWHGHGALWSAALWLRCSWRRSLLGPALWAGLRAELRHGLGARPRPRSGRPRPRHGAPEGRPVRRRGRRPRRGRSGHAAAEGGAAPAPWWSPGPVQPRLVGPGVADVGAAVSVTVTSGTPSWPSGWPSGTGRSWWATPCCPGWSLAARRGARPDASRCRVAGWSSLRQPERVRRARLRRSPGALLPRRARAPVPRWRCSLLANAPWLASGLLHAGERHVRAPTARRLRARSRRPPAGPADLPRPRRHLERRGRPGLT